MKKLYFYLSLFSLIIIGCSPETEGLENDFNEVQDFSISLEKIVFEEQNAQSLKSFVISEDSEGNLVIEESKNVISDKDFKALTESDNSHFVKIDIEKGLSRSLTICCSSGRMLLSKCVTCSGGNMGNCASDALKKCSVSNKRDMIYNPKDGSFSIFGR